MTEPTRLLAHEMAVRLRQGEVSSRELAEAHLDAAERDNAGLNAWLSIDRERRLHHVIAQDVLELDRLGGRRYVVGRQLGEDRVLVQDVVELGLESRQLLVGQPETGKMCDVFDIGS